MAMKNAKSTSAGLTLKRKTALDPKSQKDLTATRLLRAQINDLADQLCLAVDGDFNFKVKVDAKDETIEKLQMLINFVLDSASRSVDELQRKSGELGDALQEVQCQQFALDEHAIVTTTDTDGKISYANDTFCKISQYSREELLGQDHRMLNSGHHSKEFFRGMWQTLLNGEVWRGEVKNRRKDGSHYWANTTIVPFTNEAGDITQFVAIRTDISSHKETVERMKTALRDAEVSTRAKAEFLANMSHEIRTPMNGVIGLTDLLLDTELDAIQREYTETVRKSGDALLDIINDILDFSKIDAGKILLESIEFDLRNTIEDSIELLHPKAAKGGLELLSQVHGNVPERLRGDPGRIRQILLNLINNAIKFTPRGGISVIVSVEKQDDQQIVLRFAIKDTGIGIEPSQISNLFNSFVQADPSTKRKYGGTGLGLTISKQLTTMMGGEIGVESEAQKGSTFWFTVRLERAPETTPSETLSQCAEALSRKSVLIVEEDATSQKALVEILKSSGCVPTIVQDAKSALEELRKASAANAPFCAAVINHRKSTLDGAALGQSIKADPSIAATKLVLLTSLGRKGDGAAFTEIGFSGYLINPVKPSDLLGCLSSVLAKPTKPSRTEKPILVTRHTLKEQKRKTLARVLVAEDNLVNQKVAQKGLEKLGYRVDVVENGVQAVEAVGRASYDAILMDCQMPEMDGYEATAEIRRIQGTAKHTPIIAVTANAMDGDRENCLAAGMDDYLAKPLSMKKLRETLEKWIGDQSSPDNAETTAAAKTFSPRP